MDIADMMGNRSQLRLPLLGSYAGAVAFAAGVVFLAAHPAGAIAPEQDAGSASAAADTGEILPVQDDARAAALSERRRLIAAATESAVDRLMRNIEAEQIRPGLTVGQLLERLGKPAREEMLRLVRSGRQVGGPRFPMPGLAEVQLQVAGADVAATLLRLAGEPDAQPPVPVEQLRRNLASWQGRPFVATGGSAASELGAELRPAPDRIPPSWVGVSEEGTQQAVSRAETDAVNQFIKAARPVRVLDHVPRNGDSTGDAEEGAEGEQAAEDPSPLTLDTVFKSGNVEAETRQWLSERPYSRLVFGDGREVEVKLSVEPAEWVEQLRVSMSNPELEFPHLSDEDWEELVVRLAERLRSDEVGSIVGRGVAPDPAENGPAALSLPPRAPDWSRLPVTVEATASAPQSEAQANLTRKRLLARSAATDAARQQLRTRLESLPVAEGQTLGQIAQAHPAVAALLDAAAKDAPVKSTSYGTNGSATVQVAVNPAVLWHSIQRYATTGSAAPSQAVPAPIPQ